VAKHYIMDMDGVIVRGTQLVPGAAEFIKRLAEAGRRFLILTNNSMYTPRDLANRLRYTGIEVAEEHIYTSAIATARFLHSQRPQGSAYAIGEAGLTTAILVTAGARFIATNPDPTGPADGGIAPATGAVAALIERATGVAPYYVGKPNPLMLRTALRVIDAHSEDTVMIGDRMDTDIVMGIESGLETVLVLTGVTTREQVERFPYQPVHILESVVEIEV
jgi:NagD protein